MEAYGDNAQSQKYIQIDFNALNAMILIWHTKKGQEKQASSRTK